MLTLTYVNDNNYDIIIIISIIIIIIIINAVIQFSFIMLAYQRNGQLKTTKNT